MILTNINVKWKEPKSKYVCSYLKLKLRRNYIMLGNSGETFFSSVR